LVKLQSDLFGVTPYIDPKRFRNKPYTLNKTSDVYSIGVLLWEISSGQPPFRDEDFSTLQIKILQGLREKEISGTPSRYIKVYTGKCNILIFYLFTDSILITI